MANEGISLKAAEFRKLKPIDRDTILFENTETIKQWMGFRKIREFGQELAITALFTLVGILFWKVWVIP